MNQEPEHFNTTRRLLGWGWGASLAAGALAGVLTRSVGAGAVVAGIGASLPIFYGLGAAVLDDLQARGWFGYLRKLARERDALTTQHIATQNKLYDLREIRPDERGRLPLLYGSNGILRDPNSLRAFTLTAVLDAYPQLERLDWMIKTLIALQGVNAGNAKQADELLAAGHVVELTGSTLDGLMTKYDFRPRLHQVLIGECVDESTGAAQPLTLDIPKAVHVLCTGASGLGKSTLLEAIALQLAGLDGVQLAAVDYGSGTFDRLEPALRWQIADTPGLAIALFAELIELANERKERYKAVGRVRSLDQYNALSGENLPFVACFVDETSALLEHAGTKDKLIELARTGRKYGVGLILGGTDFKATTLPTEARSNCQARIAFWLEPGLSRSLLNNEAASELGKVGDIVLQRPGVVGTVKGHTPNVTDADYTRLKLDGAPGQPPQALEAIDEQPAAPGLTDKQINAVLDLHYAGQSVTAISKAVLGYANARTLEQVRSAIAEYDSDNEAPADDESGDL